MMSFDQILKELIKNVSGAEAAVLSDYDGEPIAEALNPASNFDQYTIQLLGAQLRAPLDYFEKIHETVKLSKPQSISIRSEERNILIWLLNDRYFVLLTVKNGHGIAEAEYQLRKSAHLLSQEL